MYPQLRMDYPAEIREAVDALVPFVRDTALHKKMNPYYAAVKLLEGDEWVDALMNPFMSCGAFAYLLFILLYFPCVAAIAAVYRETGLMWTIFAGAWTTGLAYMASVLFYQTATMGRHPASSSA